MGCRAVGLVGLVVLAGCGDPRVFIDAAPPGDGRRDDAVVDDPVDAGPVDAVILDAPPVLTAPTSFAAALGALCGVGYDHVAARVWVYPCNGATVHAFTAAGAAVGTLPRPGEVANDVDVAFAPAPIVIGATAVAAGAMLFINGETGVAEVHLPTTAGAPPLVTRFGDSHVVGGGYHPARRTLFVVQDGVPATRANTVAEVDPVTGAVVAMFSTLPGYAVNYGDLEVCPSSGNLFVVSSSETTIAELTATGTLVGTYALPAGVVAVSGLALGPDGAAWLVGTGGQVWRLAGLPCAALP